MEQSNANAQLTKQIADLTNVDRLISNTLNLIADMDIKGAYSRPVAEIQDWLTSFKSTIATQKMALESALPRPEKDSTLVNSGAVEARLDVPALSPLAE